MEKDAQGGEPEKRAYLKMARFCSQREYCTYDILRKLKRMELDAPTVERILSDLKKERYIDDLRYCRSFVSDKTRFAGWGRVKIEYSLRAKRIPQEMIAEAFDDFSDKSITRTLRPLIEKKWKLVEGSTVYERRAKVIRFALGRGFLLEDILECLDNVGED